jgi:hypothetical protein
MSAQTLETILSRAMSDTTFTEALFANPEKALAGYDLTAEEIANLKDLPRAEFNKAAVASPEERKSFIRIMNHNETALSVRQ